MKHTIYHQVENLNNEYFSVYKENKEIVIHVAFYQARLNNKQVDELIKILKHCKVYE